MTEGDDVTSNKGVRQMEDRIRELERQLGRKTLEAENRRLKRELARVTEERDILKKATAYFARESQ